MPLHARLAGAPRQPAGFTHATGSCVRPPHSDVRTIGRTGRFSSESFGGEISNGGVHGLDLDDEVVETLRIDPVEVETVDEFEGHELVIGELEHRQAAFAALRDPLYRTQSLGSQ